MKRYIQTNHGRIAVTESEGRGLVVLFIHGNSSCKEVFRDQLDSDLGRQYHCVAMDLPGHGSSEDAADPESTYTMTGYAHTALEVMAEITQGPFAVVGWSLGGHVGIEMLAHSMSIAGLALSGTPPVGQDPEDMANGFLPHPHMTMTGLEHFSEAQADDYARTTCGTSRYEAFLAEAVRRTDGRARRVMMTAAAAGAGVNQRRMVESTEVPIAILNGRQEPLVNNEFVTSLQYNSLWQGRVALIDNAGHAPFWDQPAQFNQLLQGFLASL